MEKRLKNYITKIMGLDLKQISETEKIEIASKMLIQIRFFQHERLIHLIVTITFAILTLLSILGCFIEATLAIFALTALFVALLVPYIRHYYILENGVQTLYKLYDEIINDKFVD